MLFNKILGKTIKICVLENFLEDFRVYSDEKSDIERSIVNVGMSG